MLIIPEIETIVILVPKTATRSILDAVEARYPKAIKLYRHMEADGVPHGYDRWEKVGAVRNPMDRLWSLFKYLREYNEDLHSEYFTMMKRDAQSMSFSHWLLNNRIPFTDPYHCNADLRYFPKYAVKHVIPENRKSQYIYLRPDLGTTIYKYSDINSLADRLDIKLGRANCTSGENIKVITNEAQNYLDRVFEWDFNNC